ncbi:hypothetical protein [Rickettsia conorii]|uniref:hypothetical protein n=1 Tax=Rickettsia conorii TaxID=781 RepID=UPI002260C1BE|nr:hypothetical protein [Rickettsia conorii]UZW38256.1 hypothetical protein OSR38_04585 [Rickettsia conorii subsp. heilongjiangensis]
MNYYNVLGSIDINNARVNLNITNRALEINANNRPFKLIVDEDFSIKIAEFNTYDSLVIEIYQGIALRILDEECPSMPITLGQNAKVNFIYENEQYTFTNHYQDKMSFQDINTLAKIANLPHKEFVKILSNNYTLEEIKEIADKYKAIDKEALNLYQLGTQTMQIAGDIRKLVASTSLVDLKKNLQNLDSVRFGM